MLGEGSERVDVGAHAEEAARAPLIRRERRDSSRTKGAAAELLERGDVLIHLGALASRASFPGGPVEPSPSQEGLHSFAVDLAPWCAVEPSRDEALATFGRGAVPEFSAQDTTDLLAAEFSSEGGS